MDANDLGVLIEVYDARRAEDPDVVAMREGVDDERLINDHVVETRYCEIKNVVPTENYLRIVGDDDFTDVEIRIHHKTLKALGWQQLSSSWQPIESAPVGQSVLIYIPNAEHYGEGIYRALLIESDFITNADGTHPRHWQTTGLHIGRDCLSQLPTHWMPLPDPPESK